LFLQGSRLESDLPRYAGVFSLAIALAALPATTLPAVAMPDEEIITYSPAVERMRVNIPEDRKNFIRPVGSEGNHLLFPVEELYRR
jgi:hypothetical protein